MAAMETPQEVCCLEHSAPLRSDAGDGRIGDQTLMLSCSHGCHVPVVRGIPRFVGSGSYATPFGRQWKAFRRTQLDSYTGIPISRERLTRCLGGALEIVRDRLVLEAGCGAGRFTEHLLNAGARVFACDLSSAVEANYENCVGKGHYFVCQADLFRLPVTPACFDLVVCLGVIQHTPSPEATIAALCGYLKPGGLLVIDHYVYGVEDMTRIRQRLRALLIRTPSGFSLPFIRVVVALLWPMHRLLWRYRSLSWVAEWRRRWLRISPVLDYHDSYAELGPELLYAWAALDTHDALADFYKHKRTAEQVEDALVSCGMEEAQIAYAGNGVEARARKPMRPVREDAPGPDRSGEHGLAGRIMGGCAG